MIAYAGIAVAKVGLGIEGRGAGHLSDATVVLGSSRFQTR
jgi:hypothetical protein